MEYEIESEEALFDPSTNPSLQCEPAAARSPVRSAKPQGDPADRRTRQKGEVIPEEERTLQMG